MNKNTDPTLYDYWLILKPYRAGILLLTLLGTALAAGLALWVIRPDFESRASILVLPQATSNPTLSLLQNLDTSLEGLEPLRNLLSPMNLPSSSVGDLVSILKSRTLTERVLQKINIRSLPEIEDLLENEEPALHQRKIVTYLQKHLKIEPPDARQGTLRVTIRLPDRHKPPQLANQYLEELRIYVRDMVHAQTLERKQFLDDQLRRSELRLQKAEDELLAFRKRYRTLSLTDEIREYIKYLSELEAEDLAARTALQETRAQLGAIQRRSVELDPNWNQVQNELEIKQLTLVKRAQEISRTQDKYRQLLANLPVQALNLARLERRVGIENRLFLLFTQQAEALRLEISRSIQMFRILDPAIEAEEPVFPIAKIFIPVAAILSLGLGILLSLLHHHWTRLKEEQDARLEE